MQHVRETVKAVRDKFAGAYSRNEFTTDRNGGKTIEILGASFYADEPSIFGEVNYDYVQAELDWYESRSTNVNDLHTKSGNVPPAWQATATKHGEINSNYGHLIHSPLYFDQYNNVLHELSRNADSRRATMVYNRPSIWVEYNQGGKSDFICTNSVAYYIRTFNSDINFEPVKAVSAVVQMRSNDAWAGYRNDYAWQRHVLEQLTEDLNSVREDDDPLEVGAIFWQVQSLHVYQRDFWRVDAYSKTGNPFIAKDEYLRRFGKEEFDRITGET